MTGARRVAEQPSRVARPARITLAMLLALACWASASTGLAQAKAPKHPNIVVIQSDDQNLAQADPTLMPKLDRFMRQGGMSLRRYFVSLPLCCPSRATMMTGRYAHNTRVFSNLSPLGGYKTFDNRHAMPIWLQKAGYKTAHVGHFLSGYGNRSTLRTIPPGWNHWVASPGNSAYRMYDYKLNVEGKIRHFGSTPDDYQTDVDADYATQFIRNQKKNGKPFYLQVDPLAPHSEVNVTPTPPCQGPRPAPRDEGIFSSLPFETSPSYDEADVSDKPEVISSRPPLTQEQQDYIKCSYYRERESLPALDDLVGRVVRSLRDRKLLGRTYIFYISDNGFMEGQHRIIFGKDNPYMESIRVPAFVRGPGIKPGSTYGQLSANIDLAPTIMSLTHTRARADRSFDGVSLANQLQGASPKRNRSILLEYFEPRYWPPYIGLVNGRYAYWRYLGSDEQELYDYMADPYELENLANDPDQADLVEQLDDQTLQLEGCSGESCQ